MVAQRVRPTAPTALRPTLARLRLVAEQRSRQEWPDDPVTFAREILGHDPWAMPEQIMRAVARPRSRVAVKACHSSGKTFSAAELVIWWVVARGGIALTTAPGGRQVAQLLWKELRRAVPTAMKPLPGLDNLNLTEWNITPTNYALGLATNEGVRFQGFHGDVLIVVDETPGVSGEVFEAIEGIRAGGDVRVLLLGNPTVASGQFYAAFTTERRSWKTFTIDAFATPNLEGLTVEAIRDLADDDPALDTNVRPYLVTRRWVKEKLTEWGEDSPLWQARVRGQFPRQSEDSLLSLAWLEAARLKDSVPVSATEPVHAGLDVAGPGEDETVLVIRQGPTILDLIAWHQPDPRGAVVAALRPWRRDGRELTVNVDSVGIGYYLAQHLRDEGFTVNEVNVGEVSTDKEKYANAKAEYYWGLRLRAQANELAGLTDETAIGQMAGIRYSHNARGQIVIESKADLRKRGVKSPDRAEAVMLAFAQVPRTPMPVLRFSSARRVQP